MTRNLLILTLLVSAAGGVANAKTMSEVVNVQGMTSAEAQAKISQIADQLCRDVQDPIDYALDADIATSCHRATMDNALRQLKTTELSAMPQRQVLAAR